VTGWVSADVVAEYLSVDRAWVYQHATELGAHRLGNGPKARLRFRLEDVDAALTSLSSRGSGEAESRVAVPVRRHRQAWSSGTSAASVPLLPVGLRRGRAS
jgi:hypothetical protein